MKKLLFTFLTLILFMGYGVAQKANDVKLEAPTRLGAKQVKAKSVTTTSNTDLTVASQEVFEGEQAFMDNLKATNPIAYSAYLKERLDIRSLNKCLSNKNLSATEKAQLEAKLNVIETKYGLK
jgi:hypothetical protein